MVKNLISKQIPSPLNEPLSSIPINIGGWESNELNMDKRIIKILGVDDILYRSFRKEDNVVYVYVGYYESQKEGALIHSPKHCVYGAGWDILEATKIDIKLKNVSIHANKLILQKDVEKRLVLYWYQNGRKTIANEYIAKLDLIKETILNRKSNGALVRVSTQIKSNTKTSLERTIGFIKVFYPYLAKCFKE